MAWSMTRTIGYNLNTRGVNEPVIRRPGLIGGFGPRRPNGIYRPGTDYIEFLMAPTPTKGVGDPRVMGQRRKYQLNTMTVTD